MVVLVTGGCSRSGLEGGGAKSWNISTGMIPGNQKTHPHSSCAGWIYAVWIWVPDPLVTRNLKKLNRFFFAEKSHNCAADHPHPLALQEQWDALMVVDKHSLKTTTLLNQESLFWPLRWSGKYGELIRNKMTPLLCMLYVGGVVLYFMRICESRSERDDDGKWQNGLAFNVYVDEGKARMWCELLLSLFFVSQEQRE